MDSGMRKVAVDTEIIADIVLRDYLYYSHVQNRMFADKPYYYSMVGTNGKSQPVRMMPDQLQKELDFRIKISTDKDFRPQMSRRLIEFLQTITSVKQMLPPDLQMNLKPYIEMFTRLAGIDPRRVFPPMEPGQAMQNLAIATSGMQRPPLSDIQEATIRGIESNPERFQQQRETTNITRQGGILSGGQ